MVSRFFFSRLARAVAPSLAAESTGSEQNFCVSSWSSRASVTGPLAWKPALIIASKRACSCAPGVAQPASAANRIIGVVFMGMRSPAAQRLMPGVAMVAPLDSEGHVIRQGDRQV